MSNLIRRVIRKVTGESRATDIEGALKSQRILSLNVDGITTKWAILNPGDEIQYLQSRDGFYEIDELRELKRQLGNVENVLDIGANIGNHSVFFAHHMGAKRVIPVEPFPATSQHLMVNLSLNYSSRFDLRLVGKALGDGASKMRFVPPSAFNSGMTKLVQDPTGEIEALVGDSVFSGEDLDFIKVDVEGMELSVLLGLKNTLQRCKPAVFVEVTTDTEQGVRTLMSNIGYKESYSSSMYVGNRNILFRQQHK